MIHAVVLHHDRAAIIELPKEPVELEMELAAIGIQENPKRIWIQDEDGRPVRIQLFSQSDRENHAAGLFTAGNTLEEVNQCAHLLQSMHEGIADAVEEKLFRYKYAAPQELMDDIRTMTEDLIAVTVDYDEQRSPADTEKRSGTGRFTVHFEKYEARRPYEDEKRYVYHQYGPLRI